MRLSPDARRAEERDVLAANRCTEQVLGVLDDDVTGAIEERCLVLVRWLNVQDPDVDVVVLPRHLFDAEDDGRSVVVAGSEANLFHGAEGREGARRLSI